MPLVMPLISVRQNAAGFEDVASPSRPLASDVRSSDTVKGFLSNTDSFNLLRKICAITTCYSIPGPNDALFAQYTFVDLVSLKGELPYLVIGVFICCSSWLSRHSFANYRSSQFTTRPSASIGGSRRGRSSSSVLSPREARRDWLAHVPASRLYAVT